MRYILLFALLLTGILSNAQNSTVDDIVNKAKDLFSNNQLNIDEIKNLTTNYVGNVVSDLAVDKAFYNDPKIFISLPKQYDAVKSTVARFGGESIVSDLEKKLNEAAEETIAMAKPLLANAVKQLSIADVIDIAADRKDGFTNYLDSKTNNALTANITPSIKNHLEKTGTYDMLNQFFKYYKKAAGFFGKRIPNGPDLETYVANQAVAGLFLKLGEKETTFRAEKLPNIFSK